jgi:hypothetical protein
MNHATIGMLPARQPYRILTPSTDASLVLRFVVRDGVNQCADYGCDAPTVSALVLVEIACNAAGLPPNEKPPV